MPSHFDQLVEELRRAEIKQRGGSEFAKSDGIFDVLPRVDVALSTTRRKLDTMAKVLPAAPPKAQVQRGMLLKSLTALNLKIGQGAADGSLTAVQVAELEGRLHGLVQRAAPHFAVERQ